MVETQLRWFEHAERRSLDSLVKRVVKSLEVEEDQGIL